MKKIDLLTVLISSATLVLFCLCSYLLVWQYSKIRDDIDRRNNVEINKTIGYLKQIDEIQVNQQINLDLIGLSDQLENNIRAIQGHQSEWLLLRDTLKSFVFVLFIIVLSHLIFVYTVIKSARAAGDKGDE